MEVYTQGDEVELLLNGASLGKKTAGKDAGFRTLFETTYEPGTLTAVSYEKGQEIGRNELKTAGTERTLVVEQEEYAGLKGSDQELIYVQVEMCDQNGVLVTDDNQKITLAVEGEAEVLGFGSGNPKPNYNFNEGVTELFGGRAQIILKKPSETVTLTVKAEDGMKGAITINK